MAELLFRLRGVPLDEADEIRTLLDDHGIDYYETPPSIWGVSMEAIWLPTDEQLDQAKQLLETYQQQRGEQVRAEYASLRERGEHETLLQRILQAPLRSLFYLAIALLVIYLSIKPFWGLIG